MEQKNRLDAGQIIGLLDMHDFKQLKEELESVHPVDIVDILEELNKKQRTLVFRLLAKEEAAEVFTDMNSDMREDLINALTDSELEEVMDEFENFRRSHTIKEKIIEINDLEEQGDRLYREAIRNLYTNGASAEEKLVWTELFDCCERCCDACEHTSEAVGDVIMNNT